MILRGFSFFLFILYIWHVFIIGTLKLSYQVPLSSSVVLYFFFQHVCRYCLCRASSLLATLRRLSFPFTSWPTADCDVAPREEMAAQIWYYSYSERYSGMVNKKARFRWCYNLRVWNSNVIRRAINAWPLEVIFHRIPGYLRVNTARNTGRCFIF